MVAMPAPSGVAVYGSGIGPAADTAAGTAAGWPPARDCPAVVVNVYRYPGRSTVVNVPSWGWMSLSFRNWPGPRRLEAHTWTVAAGRPPVTWMVSGCAAVAAEVSATIVQADRLGAMYVS